MTLTLYSNPRSRGRIARWMMEEAAQPYEVIYLGFDDTMKDRPYLDLNPMGKVPTLVHDGRVITEYSAICAYMADTFPEAGLKPADPSSYYRWLFFGAGPLEQAMSLANLKVEIADAARGWIGCRPLAETLDVLDGWLTDHPYLAGDRFSAADVATGSQIIWGVTQFRTIDPRPSFSAYIDRMVSRAAYQRAAAADNAAMGANNG